MRGLTFSGRDAVRPQKTGRFIFVPVKCVGVGGMEWMPAALVYPWTLAAPAEQPRSAAPYPELGLRLYSMHIPGWKRDFPRLVWLLPFSTPHTPCTSTPCLVLSLKRRRVIPSLWGKLTRKEGGFREVRADGFDGYALPAFERGMGCAE